MALTDFPIHLSPADHDPRGREAAVAAVNAAVRLLCVRHQVRETSGYAILVQASIDSQVSVREAAARIVAADNP